MSPRFFALYLLRAMGVFALAKYLTRKHLRILCYHGFSVGDEHEVAPVMFMRAEIFTGRMRLLHKRRIPVVTLNEGVKKLTERTIRNAETVITFDDGWASNLSVAVPILEGYGFPACIYISTEHLEAGTEVFNVALSYMVRRSGLKMLTLEGVHPAIDGTYDIATNPDAAIVGLIVKAQDALPLAERQQLLRPIAQALGANINEILSGERFRLLSRDEIGQVFRRGIDIQLHTHTHHLPDTDFEEMALEIRKNRKMIEELTGAEARHFCYPSGEHSERHPEWLRRLGIASATTCHPGLNNGGTSVMLLNRLLDSDSTSEIAFEAQICGVYELARKLLGSAAAGSQGDSGHPH
jgi:peptidoglycan/xylan/chitin deacetylase (PgdA/CDA1 family)